MLEPSTVATEHILQQNVFKRSSCSSKQLTLLLVCISSGLVALRIQIPRTSSDVQRLRIWNSAVSMTWQQLPTRPQHVADPKNVQQFLQPARNKHIKLVAAAVPDNFGAMSENVDAVAAASRPLSTRRIALGALGGSISQMLLPAAHAASRSMKIVVVGGDGFIGSYVCRQLTRLGSKVDIDVQVVAINRKRPEPPAWAAQEIEDAVKQKDQFTPDTVLAAPRRFLVNKAPSSWAKRVDWIAADALTDDYVPLLNGADAVISCLNSFGSEEDEKINGEANIRVVDAAVKANVTRFVYVAPHPVVTQVLGSSYPASFKGKEEAEKAMKARFSNTDLTIFRPTTVFGGDDFLFDHVLEPRAWLESIFSLYPTEIPGQWAPVDVDALARSVCFAALGLVKGGDVTGHDAIIERSYALALGGIKLPKTKRIA